VSDNVSDVLVSSPCLNISEDNATTPTKFEELKRSIKCTTCGNDPVRMEHRLNIQTETNFDSQDEQDEFDGLHTLTDSSDFYMSTFFITGKAMGVRVGMLKDDCLTPEKRVVLVLQEGLNKRNKDACQ
jgi:hypothetical protein